MPKTIEIEVNGKRYPVQYDPETPLLYVLRDELGLTGSKYGCGEGQCGACTVLIGGAPRRSCQIPVSAAVGKPVTTVEGLEKDGHLHPIQKAFGDAYGLQCGYCTPGLMLSTFQLLSEHPAPDEKEIRKAIAGNTCRCTGYMNIFKAVQLAGRNMKGASEWRSSLPANSK